MSFKAFNPAAFTFTSHLNVRFGSGAIRSLRGELAALQLNRVFFITDPGVKKAGMVDGPVKALEDAGIAVELFSEVEANPRDTTIEAAVDKVKAFGAEVVIGFGGGSAMDAAKGAALLATNGGRIADYDGTDRVRINPLPLVAVPTTAGTGSEVTANAAITHTERHYKMSVRSPRIIPSLAILDPDLLHSLPKFVAATSGIDALVHAVEGFLSLRSSALSDVIAREAMRLLYRNLRPFVAHPANPEAAGAMLFGSMLAGIVISNTGTGNDHAIARALGGVCDVAHGVATAIMLPPVLQFNALARPEKMSLIAEDFELSTAGGPQITARRVVEELQSLLVDLGVPTTLSEVGVTREVVPNLVEVAIGNVGPNPRRTTKGDIERLILSVF